MDLDARLLDAQRRSVAVYLRRQQIEGQRQQLAIAATQTDQELLLLDGEIRAYEAMKKEPA